MCKYILQLNHIIIIMFQIISAGVICIVQIMAVLMAFDISDNVMDYTIVTLIALFLFIWLIFYLFNVAWKDDDDDLIESHVRLRTLLLSLATYVAS